MAKFSNIQIIYQDDNILVVNKPADLSVTKDRSGQPQMLDLLEKQIGLEAASQLRLVHRLDKQTSGVLLLAKNLETQSRISSAFEKRLVNKVYLAVTAGAAIKDSGQINARIIASTTEIGKMRLTNKKGKLAQTNWRLLADFGNALLLAVSPVTGRTHQIRVHLPSASMPLMIDPLYGSDKGIYLSEFKPGYQLGKYQTEQPLMERLTLHAYQLTIPQPDGQRQTFIAGLDKNFKAAIKMLTKHNSKGIEAFKDKDDFEKILDGQPLAENL